MSKAQRSQSICLIPPSKRISVCFAAILIVIVWRYVIFQAGWILSSNEVSQHIETSWRFDDSISEIDHSNVSLRDAVLQQIKGKAHWDWIRHRIERLWKDFELAADTVKRNFIFHHNKSFTEKKILLAPGIITMTNFADPSIISAGGPVGELMQWADLIAGLQVLGHTLFIRTNLKKVSVWLRIQKDDSISLGLSGNCLGTEIDIIFTDIIGYWALDEDVRQGYKGKFRILDDFGTEAVFNDPEYAEHFMGISKDYKWGKLSLNLKQFYTLFPHTPDNSFLGFVVPQISSNEKKREHVAVLYGKEARYLKENDNLLRALANYVAIKTTMTKIPKDVLLTGLIENLGVLSAAEYTSLLGKIKLFVGLGNPVEGVGVMNALAAGCIILNPRRHGSEQLLSGKPTTRKLSSQIPYLENFIGPPNVLTVDYTNATDLQLAIKLAMKTDIKPLLPREFSITGFIERLAEYVEHQNFCNTHNESTTWPPPSELQVFLTQSSCNTVCYSHGLVCEPTYFPLINNLDYIQKSGKLTCSTAIKEADPRHPSFSVGNGICYMQSRDTLFSCAQSGNITTRVCPCRSYILFQIALPRHCL